MSLWLEPELGEMGYRPWRPGDWASKGATGRGCSAMSGEQRLALAVLKNLVLELESRAPEVRREARRDARAVLEWAWFWCEVAGVDLTWYARGVRREASRRRAA